MATTQKIRDSLRIFGNMKAFEITRVQTEKADTKFYTRPEDFFLRADQKRRKKKAKARKFEIQTVSIDLDSPISGAEAKADELVWLKDVVYCDQKFRVFLGHDIVDLTKARKEPQITICRFISDVSAEERMAIILRKAAKSADFPTMARVEAIRESVDSLGWSFATIRDIMVVRNQSKLSLSDISSEYHTAKIYEEFCDYTTPTTGHALSDFPDTFSKFKFLNGTKEVREIMEGNREMREYFVNMAIATTVTGEERFQDNVPKILKHARPRRVFLEERGGYRKAVSELQAIHPESDRKSFPHYDFVAGNEKLNNPDNQKVLTGQINKNPEGNPTLNVFASSLSVMAGLCAPAFLKFARTLSEVNRAQLVKFVVRTFTDDVVEELNKFRGQIRRIK